MKCNIFYFLIITLISCNKQNNSNGKSLLNSNVKTTDSLKSIKLSPEEINEKILSNYVDGVFIVETMSKKPIWYYENGAIQRLYLVTKETNNLSDLYYSKQHTKTLDFFDNGHLRSKVEYVGRNQHGEQLFYWDNGNLEHRSTFNLGRKQGEEIYYFKNGKLFMKFNYIDDKRDGESIRYFSDGNLEWKIRYKNGIQIGNSIEYYQNGKVKQKCIDDIDFRICQGYFENGKQSSELKYNLNTGKLASKIFYDENGKIIEQAELDFDGNEINNNPVIESYDTNGKLLEK